MADMRSVRDRVRRLQAQRSAWDCSMRSAGCAVALACIMIFAGGTVIRRDHLVVDTFDRPDGLIVNELSAAGRGGRTDPVWKQTSGSLFADGRVGYSGQIDASKPDVTSRDATNSAVFRVVTQNAELGDVNVDLKFRIERYGSTSQTPEHDWDGLHLFMRYADANNLYSFSFARRDGTVAIKRKAVVSDANATYATLRQGRLDVPVGTWHDLAASARNTAEGVLLEFSIDDKRVLQALDADVDGRAHWSAGRVGIRGDNVEFRVDNFLIR